MPSFPPRKTHATFLQRLRINDYHLPDVDGNPNEGMTCDGDANVFFGGINVTISGTIGGGGSGTDNRIVRWDGSENFQDSQLALDDSGNLSGVSTIVVTGTANFGELQFPVTDGASGQAVVTDGSGVLSFASLATSGSGTALNLARWNGTTNVQDSLVDATSTSRWNIPGGVTVSGDVDIVTRFESTGHTSLACIDVSISDGATRCNMIGSAGCAIETGAVRCGMISCTSGRIETNNANCCQITSNSCVIDASSRNATITSSFNCSLANASQCGIMAASNSRIDTECRNSAIVCSTSCNIDTSCNASVLLGGVGNAMDRTTASAALATEGSRLTDTLNCAIMASLSCSITGMVRSAIVGCTNVDLSSALGAENVVVMASDTVDNRNLSGVNSEQIVFGGANGSRNWMISSVTGTYYANNPAITAPVPDFAEYFENDVSGEVLPYGTFIALSASGNVKVAISGDKWFGVVSSRPGIAAGGADLHWQGAHDVDEWGRWNYDQVPNKGWKRRTPGELESWRPLKPKARLNAAFDPKRPYLPRSERPAEWTCVGLVGQLRTRVDASVTGGVFIAPDSSGVGTTSLQPTGARVMHILPGQEYRADRGYGIALALLKSFI
jgi:hypothetical protein